MPKGGKVDRTIKAIERNITPRRGETREQAAIKVAKSRGMVHQRGRHLAAGPKRGGRT